MVSWIMLAKGGVVSSQPSSTSTDYLVSRVHKQKQPRLHGVRLGLVDDHDRLLDRHDTTLLRHPFPWRRAKPAAAERLGVVTRPPAHGPGTAGSRQARGAAARPPADALRGRLRGRFPHVRLLRRDRAGAAVLRALCTVHLVLHHTACALQALPAALMRSGSSANAATTLGTLGSVSALVEVMLSNSFGKLTDAIGRKPVLILAPALAVAARATVVAWPTLPVLLGARFCTTLVVPLLRLARALHVHCMCTACALHMCALHM